MLMKDMLRGNMLTTASVMYRWKYYGEEFRKVYPDGILPGDWFIHLLHARDGKIGYLPEPMSFPRARLRPEKIGSVCGEGGGCMFSRSLGDLGPPGALFHVWSASSTAAKHSL